MPRIDPRHDVAVEAVYTVLHPVHGSEHRVHLVVPPPPVGRPIRLGVHLEQHHRGVDQREVLEHRPEPGLLVGEHGRVDLARMPREAGRVQDLVHDDLDRRFGNVGKSGEIESWNLLLVRNLQSSRRVPPFDRSASVIAPCPPSRMTASPRPASMVMLVAQRRGHERHHW